MKKYTAMLLAAASVLMASQPDRPWTPQGDVLPRRGKAATPVTGKITGLVPKNGKSHFATTSTGVVPGRRGSVATQQGGSKVRDMILIGVQVLVRNDEPRHRRQVMVEVAQGPLTKSQHVKDSWKQRKAEQENWNVR